MKKLLIILFSFLCVQSFAQVEDTTKYMKYPNSYGPQYTDIWATRVMRLPDTTGHRPQLGVPGALGRNTEGTVIFVWDGFHWNQLASAVINGLNQPGYVTWSGDGLTFDVTSGFFTIDGITYDGNAGSITLDPADATFPRFDVIGWDTTGAVIKVTGTAGMNPAIPQVDPDYQIGLTVISIPAGATVPGGITQDVIYDENSEGWTGAATGITVDLDDTDNPYHLTKSADAGAWAPTPKTLTFTNDTGTVDANDYGILKLFINLKDTIAGIGNIRVSFLNGSTAVSNIVSLGGGVGFNRSTINSYQNISVPLSSFTFTNTLFDKVRITFAGTGAGAYIDYIQLQGGITPPTVAGVYQDTTYYRNDTLFGRKNNREFEIGKLGLAKLIQQQFIVIYNPDSTYDPYTADVAIGVDTSGLARWIVNNVIDNDTTIANIIEDVDYVVDTISNAPPVGAVNGDKVLVGTSPTGAFAGHANEVAELVGGVWTFTIPEAGETLEVRNSTQLLFYKFDGTDWNLISVPDLIGGMTGLTAPDIGTRDSNSFTIKTKNIPAIVVDATQHVKLPEFANLEDSNVYFRPTVDGKIDTAYFSELIAGSGITITPGPNRTDTIKSTGGGGSVTVETGGKSDIDSNLVYNGGTFKKASPLGYINIMDYPGASNDSTGDNKTAIEAAIAAAPDRGGVIYFPSGVYLSTPGIVVDKQITFIGAGQSFTATSATRILTNSATGDLFYATAPGVTFRNFEIRNVNANPSAGSAIRTIGESGFKMDFMYIRGFFNNTVIRSGYHWSITNSIFFGAVNYNLSLADTASVDAGDGVIIGCWFYGIDHTPTAHIFQESGGGTKILANKFNTRAKWCYLGDFNGETGLILFNTNSCENYTEGAFKLTGNGNFSGNAVINGNQMASFSDSAVIDIEIIGDADMFLPFTISDNVFATTNTDASTAVNVNDVDNIAVSNFNYFNYATPTVFTACTNKAIDNAFGGYTFDDGITNTAGTVRNDLITGVAGGQEMYGGTAANDDLAIYGTSNGTKTTSYVNLQPVGGGKVGINTTAPTYPLSIGADNIGFETYTSGGGVDALKLNNSGTGATFALQNNNAGGFSGIEYMNNSGSTAVFTGYSNSSAEFRFNNIAGSGIINFLIAGNSGLRVNNDRTVTMAAYGAGTATFDASGNISSVSDERVKRNIHPYRTGLRELMKINPISFQYNGLSGNEINGTYAGFSAQNVGANIPNSTGVTADGYLTLQDRAILATLVNAVKEQQQEIEELKAEIKRMKK